MPLLDDQMIFRKLPFLKDGMVMYVAGPNAAGQDRFIEEHNIAIQDLLSEFSSQFVFIPELLESIPESVQDYLFPTMERADLASVYTHIRRVAGVGNKTGLLCRKDSAVFFREIGPDVDLETFVKLADTMAPSENILFRRDSAHPAKEKKQPSKFTKWIRKQTSETAEAAEAAFDLTMGELFDEMHSESCESYKIEPPTPKIGYMPPVEEIVPDERTASILAEIDKLTARFHISVEDLVVLLDYKVTLSHLKIYKSGRIFLSDFGKEVKMDLRAQAFYFLFLRHPEGIRFKDMADYREELTDIYWRMADRDRADVEKTIDILIDPLGNEMNVCASRIKAAFRNQVGDHVAKFYILEGPAGGKKKVPLDRDLVIWEY